MPLWLTAATYAGAGGLAERASLRPFGSCMFCTHLRQPTSGCSWADGAPSGRDAEGCRRCEQNIHGPNSLDNACSVSPRAPALVAPISHDGILSEAPSHQNQANGRKIICKHV